jgi:hypothetical protein
VSGSAAWPRGKSIVVGGPVGGEMLENMTGIEVTSWCASNTMAFDGLGNGTNIDL